MQIYSKARPHWEPERGRSRKLSAATAPSHGFVHTRRSRSAIFALAAGLICVLGCASASGANPPTSSQAARTGIDAGELARDLTAFAHDSMRGRETGTN